MKKWLRAQPNQPLTIAHLQTLIECFTDAYNHHRPHRSPPHQATPAAIYTNQPKAQPAGSRDGDTHIRVRVVTATTGELLRELTIDATRDYQPQYTKKPPNP